MRIDPPPMLFEINPLIFILSIQLIITLLPDLLLLFITAIWIGELFNSEKSVKSRIKNKNVVSNETWIHFPYFRGSCFNGINLITFIIVLLWLKWSRNICSFYYSSCLNLYSSFVLLSCRFLFWNLLYLFYVCSNGWRVY